MGAVLVTVMFENLAEITPTHFVLVPRVAIGFEQAGRERAEGDGDR